MIIYHSSRLLHLLSRPPCLSYLRGLLPPKSLYRLIINRGRRSTSLLESLALALIEHVLLEVAVNPRLVGLEARLLLEVAVAKVMAIAGVFDYTSVRGVNKHTRESLQSKPNGLSGEEEQPSALQSSSAGPTCPLRLLMNWLMEMLKT